MRAVAEMTQGEVVAIDGFVSRSGPTTHSRPVCESVITPSEDTVKRVAPVARSPTNEPLLFENARAIFIDAGRTLVSPRGALSIVTAVSLVHLSDQGFSTYADD